MPKILNIIIHPNPILRQKSKPIDINSLQKKKWQELCKDMALTMVKKDGVGLAAPQIGRNIRLIVVNTSDGPLCLINPVLKKKSFRREWDEEGCLSLPNIFGQVKRHLVKDIKCLRLSFNRRHLMSAMTAIFKQPINYPAANH